MSPKIGTPEALPRKQLFGVRRAVKLALPLFYFKYFVLNDSSQCVECRFNVQTAKEHAVDNRVRGTMLIVFNVICYFLLVIS